MITDLKDGFYEDIPEEEYRAWPFANASAVKILALGGAPAHYKAEVDGESESSDAKDFGKLVHMAVLEPARLDNFKLLPTHIKKRSGKDYDALCQQFPDFTWLPPSEWKKTEKQIRECKLIQAVAKANPIAADLLDRGKREVSMIWTDPESGVRCKGRMDLFANFIADVKTTSLTMIYPIARSGYRYGYHIQSAMYTDGATLLSGGIPEKNPIPFWFLFFESARPHLLSVYNGHSALDERQNNEPTPDGYLQQGRRQYKDALRTVASCMERGKWEGHPQDPQDMVIPRFAGWEGVYA